MKIIKTISILYVVSFLLIGCEKEIIEGTEIKCEPIFESEYYEGKCDPEVIIEYEEINHVPYMFNLMSKSVNGYELYSTFHGVCEENFESIFYENEEYYWYVEFTGCDYDGEFADYYYLLVDGAYIPVGKAIEDGYITLEDLDDSNIGIRVKK